MPDPVLPTGHRPASTEEIISALAAKENVPPYLALAVARKESGRTLNQNAVGDGGLALGTFQLHAGAAKDVNVDRTDPMGNLQGGVKYLKLLSDKYKGDPLKILMAYNGGEGNLDRGTISPAAQAYAQEVMADVTLLASQATRKRAAEPQTQSTQAAAPADQSWLDWGISGAKSVASAFDPRSSEGRENLAGTAAGVGVGLATGGVGVLPWIATALAPAAAGALMAGGERALGTSGETADSVAGAAASGAGRQLLYEIGGRAMLWIPRKFTRAIFASRVAQAAEKGLEDQYSKVFLEKAPSVVGAEQAVSKVVKGGAAIEAKKIAGEAVEQAAETGPVVSMKPVKSALTKMVDTSKPASVYPGQSNTKNIGFTIGRAKDTLREAASASVNPADRARFSAFIAEQAALKEGDPRALPVSGILERVSKSPDELAFKDAHSLKLLLDDRIKWQSTAKTIDERLAKGTRIALRRELSSHAPYNEATQAYQKIAPLYDARQTGGKLIKAAWSNPDAIAKALKADRPLAANAVKRLLVEQSAAGGDAQSGLAAWDAVRSHFTYNNLVTGGAKNLSERVKTLVTEHPEFAKTVYGDQAGQQVLSNLSVMGDAAKKFSESSFRDRVDPHLTNQAVDAVHALAGFHTPGGIRAGARTLLMSPKSSDFLEWVAYSPTTTKWFVHAMLGPATTASAAMLMRAWNQTSDDLVEQQKGNAALEAETP